MRTMAAISRQIAKMDAFSAKERDISAYYGLIPVQDLPFAKMAFALWEITSYVELHIRNVKFPPRGFIFPVLAGF